MAGKLTYKEAGVDTEKAAALVGDIKTHVARTQKKRQLMGSFGLFAAALILQGVGATIEADGESGAAIFRIRLRGARPTRPPAR